ncbi:hypothetical protein EWH23_06740 [Meiothermus sp. PNK-Is4]|uniref:hypothetical protein n=1 Tax=Meiothermus sp. PNK-Is4 TaxID=2740565 RepID=UPI000D7B93D5|nr:hypothetical protein [Meiothermus sp. PNK-Is4]PZA07382.1 hypothetical protein DNA98_09315 [Meiothermus sp. Pnk-1]RYM37382.1 hypothetical protein EWH23_06740 [Meiothermus sp. PNK-Is4]
MGCWAWFLLLGAAFGQSLNLPAEARVGQGLEVVAQGFPPGAYTLEIRGPNGLQQVNVQAQQGGFKSRFIPGVPGEYRVQVSVSGRLIEAQTRVLALSQTPQSSPAAPIAPPVLKADGLAVGDWHLPLKGQWSQPKVMGTRAFIYQGPLVLELDLTRPAVVAHYYPPAEVRVLETDPEPAVQLANGLRLPLAQLGGRPYEGSWDSLAVIRDYREHLKAQGAQALDLALNAPRPYWAYFATPPEEITPADLEAIGKDLLSRGHRPELRWGGPGLMRWLTPWTAQVFAARRQGLEASLAWSEFFLKYMPQFPGSRRLFAEQADWLEAQGRPDLAERYRVVLRQLEAWSVPFSVATAKAWAWMAVILYAILAVYLTLIYLPNQTRDLRGQGGWLLSWLRNPLLRLRHTVLAYASFGERLLFVLLFALAGGSLLLAGLASRVEQVYTQDALSRGTLRSQAAQEALRALSTSATSMVDALLGYSLKTDNPEQARRLLEKAPSWAFVLVNRGEPQDLKRAYQIAPGYVPAREALGLGGDFWTDVYRAAGVPREGVPTPRLVWIALLQSSAQALQHDFLHTWTALPLWDREWMAWGSAMLFLLVMLYHLLSFLIPRPRNAPAHRGWKRWVQLVFPGSPWYGHGWGVLILVGVALGAWSWYQGDGRGMYGFIAALVIHLVSWALRYGRRSTT